MKDHNKNEWLAYIYAHADFMRATLPIKYHTYCLMIMTMPYLYILLCKAKRRYLLTCEVNRYCLPFAFARQYCSVLYRVLLLFLTRHNIIIMSNLTFYSVSKWMLILHIVASELKDPICHSNECQIGSFSSEATICVLLSLLVLKPLISQGSMFQMLSLWKLVIR